MKYAFFIVNDRIFSCAKFTNTPDKVSEFIEQIQRTTKEICPPETLKNLQKEDYGDWVLRRGRVQMMTSGYLPNFDKVE